MSLPNNLTFLRLFAAALVLYGHAFVFLGQPEPLFIGFHSLGPLGVWIFFAISGYLISQSWERDPDFFRFLIRRALRIFPALIVCTLVTIFIFGPALTTLTTTEYFKNPATWGYLHNIALHTTFYLPGVFEHNRVPNAVNGSLWSLPAEFSMYMALAFLGILRWRRWGWLLLTIALAALNLLWLPKATEMLVIYRTDMRQLVICGIFFWVGASYQRYHVERWFTLTNAVLALIIWLSLTRWPTAFVIGGWFLLPFAVLSFGLARGSVLGKLNNFDYSYGIYIYAFPVQQTLALFWPNMDVWLHVFLAFSISLALAAASWHWVEQKALSFKPKTRSTKPAKITLDEIPGHTAQMP